MRVTRRINARLLMRVFLCVAQAKRNEQSQKKTPSRGGQEQRLTLTFRKK